MSRAAAAASSAWGTWDAEARCRSGAVFAYAGVTAEVESVAVADRRPRALWAIPIVARRAPFTAVMWVPSALAQQLAATWLVASPAETTGADAFTRPLPPRDATPTEAAFVTWWVAALCDFLRWHAEVTPIDPREMAAWEPGVGMGSVSVSLSFSLATSRNGAIIDAGVASHTLAIALYADASSALRDHPLMEGASPCATMTTIGAAWHAAPWAWPVSCAAGALDAAALAKLAPQTWVVGLERHAPTLHVGNVVWTLRPSNSKPRAGSKPFAVQTEMQLMTTSEQSTAALLAHGRTPVSVVIGRVELSFAQLAALAPGSVISLRHPPSHHATLCMGETAIADLELVDLEGELAARVIAVRALPPTEEVSRG